MEENWARFEAKWARAGVRTTVLHVGLLQDWLMVVWTEVLWTRGGLLRFSFGGTSMVKTPEGRRILPFNLLLPLSFALNTRASDSSSLVLTCHMHPASSIRSVPHCKSPPIAPPACSDRWTTGRRHIAAPVLPVKQGDFDWPEGPQHQCSILTNLSPHACPSQAVIVQNSRISNSILM